MAITYADIYDPEVLTKLIGADYQNEIRLANSGLIRKEGAPNEGSQLQWLKQTIFSTDDEGQTIGVGSEISLKNKVQTDYALPLVWRADGAELDDVSEDIMAKLQKDGAEADMANAISAKAAHMVDSSAIKIIDGSAAFIVSEGTNYNDAGTSQANLVDLEQTKATRGEKGVSFDSGFMVMRGTMYHKLASLGLIASTSNTMGNMKQDEIVRNGLKGTLLNMNILVTDKIGLVPSDTDHYIHFLEAGSLRMLMADNLTIDPVIRAQRAFTSSLKFKVSFGGMIDGLSWSGTKVNPALVTNTALATGTNYELAASYIKNVPMAVARFAAPTF